MQVGCYEAVPPFAKHRLTSSRSLLIRETFCDRQLREALWCLAGVSEDDLGVLVNRKIKRLSNRELRQNDALSAEVLKLVCRLADAGRFLWLQHRRPPRGHELKQAIRATAVVLASQKMQTERRAYGRAVERALRDRLQVIGYVRVTAPKEESLHPSTCRPH